MAAGRAAAAGAALPPKIAAAAPTPTNAAIQGIAIPHIAPVDNPLLLLAL